MGLAVVLIHAGWAAIGLAERGFVYTVAQIGIEVAVGGLVFVAVAWLLRLEELRAIFDLILRRRSPKEAIV